MTAEQQNAGVQEEVLRKRSGRGGTAGSNQQKR